MSELFEIHLTLQKPGGISIQEFTENCREINVTPLLLELQRNSDTVVQEDVMTSSKIYCTQRHAFRYADGVGEYFLNLGYEVIRSKFETTPNHPIAPSLVNGLSFAPDQYFECHIGVLTSSDRIAELSQIANNHNCHLSTNVFKKQDDGTLTIMLTLRDMIPIEQFDLDVTAVCAALAEYGFEHEPVKVEFCLLDTKTLHDSMWLGS